jgi:aryl-alcohol dehydrogenase-like predicted oxidoreductase
MQRQCRDGHGRRNRRPEAAADGFCVSSKVCSARRWIRPTQKGLSRKHVTDACHAALKRLRVDYLDLYYCHRPDPDTPVEETVWAMDA